MGSHFKSKDNDEKHREKGKSKEKHRDEASDSKKHRREHRDHERDSRDRKREKRDKERSRTALGTKVIDDNPYDNAEDEDDIWIEKGAADAGEPNSVANIPTRDSLALKSHAYPSRNPPPLPHAVVSESDTKERRDDWMLEDQPSSSARQPIHQSDNLHDGGTFTVGSMPTGVAKPSVHNTIEQFTDGYGDGDVGTKGSLGGDFFSSLGSERTKKPTEDVKRKAQIDAPRMSSREINTSIFAADGSRLASSVGAIAGDSASNSKSTTSDQIPTPGSSGSSWRMMKLKRAYEAAEDEKRPADEVGVERFGSLRAWEAAKEERRVLDDRASGRRGRESAASSSNADVDEFGREKRRSTPPASTPNKPGATHSGRYVFTNVEGAGAVPSSRPLSRASSFRRPGEEPEASSRASTPRPAQQQRSQSSKASTPIPSVFTPPPLSAGVRKPSQLQTSTTADQAVQQGVRKSQGDETLLSQPPMSPTSLNRLQAKILRARLMNTDSAALKDMEAMYEKELARSMQGDRGQGYFDGTEVAHGNRTADEAEIRVLPTLDGRGRLYDVGQDQMNAEDQSVNLPGNKRKRQKAEKFETRDSKTGELLRYNADDDEMSLEELVRQERFAAGQGDQKNMDIEMAARIAGDAKFEDDLDYMDDSADRLARKKIRTEQQKKMFAINDYAKTKKALDSCQFCYQDTDTTTIPPQAPMVALGTRTYLSLPLNEPLTEGHALIVPIQHHLSTLEADDDTWEEIKNFMKTLMQMHASNDKGVLFYETVVSFKGQRHTYIEAVPLPWQVFEEIPAYFREAIMTVEAEWAQHKKLIDFSARPGGFRRAMVPNLPYFMVHWDYKGEKGFGHVIEGPESATGEGDGYDFDEGAKGGGEFKWNFAAEIIGNVLELEPRLWRKPRRIDKGLNADRVKAFRKTYEQYDWTKMLSRTSD